MDHFFGSTPLTSEIATLKLNAELVVLSACKTALVDDNNSVASATSITNGLVPAFMYAGANRVVAAYWDISSKKTAQLMTKAFQSKKTTHLQEALAFAQRRIMQTKPHPAHWAAFMVYN